MHLGLARGIELGFVAGLELDIAPAVEKGVVLLEDQPQH
jgi:hypothetical protein